MSTDYIRRPYSEGIGVSWNKNNREQQKVSSTNKIPIENDSTRSNRDLKKVEDKDLETDLVGLILSWPRRQLRFATVDCIRLTQSSASGKVTGSNGVCFSNELTMVKCSVGVRTSSLGWRDATGAGGFFS